ncbi:MAG TPA: hypothetical protein PKC49_06280, partial [Phycisphaerae bacterium]|nr:hypothetical protein [Phycisphaerae bacterium]
GMLVVRAWLTAYSARKNRLKRLIGLAPATFGSPLAHKGRSWLGAMFKGNRDIFSPDFLEAGDQVLDALELGSRFTWDLAHLDMLGDEQFYGEDRRTPYVFIFCGTKGYTGLASVVNEPGTDGTVRWAGCALNTRKVVLDLTHDPALARPEDRIRIADWTNVDIPLTPIDKLNHGTIVSDPSPLLVDLALDALRVSSKAAFRDWSADARARTRAARDAMAGWQQFVIRAVDERGDPIPDYNVELETPAFSIFRPGGRRKIELHVHPYSGDKSLRCFHLNASELLDRKPAKLELRVIASSGTRLVGYHGFVEPGPQGAGGAIWDARLDITPLIQHAEMDLFYPHTTTLLELRLNREPLPLDATRFPELFAFMG